MTNKPSTRNASAASAHGTAGDELRDKSWQMYLRLCDSPSVQGKEQSYVRDIAIERTRAFLKAMEEAG